MLKMSIHSNPKSYQFTEKEYNLLNLVLDTYYSCGKVSRDTAVDVPFLYRGTAYKLVRKGLVAFTKKKVYPTSLFYEVFVECIENVKDSSYLNSATVYSMYVDKAA